MSRTTQNSNHAKGEKPAVQTELNGGKWGAQRDSPQKHYSEEETGKSRREGRGRKREEGHSLYKVNFKRQFCVNQQFHQTVC